MKKSLLILTITMSFTAFSQVKLIPPTNINQDQQEVLDVIITLFDGMRVGDSSKVHSVFNKEPQLYTSFTNKEGRPVLNKDDLMKFLNAVGSPHDVIWDEPIWNIQINIDGNLANVWTEYAFYAGKNFGHCGVDAFMLHKEQTGWKIFQLTDTRKRQGCNVPDKIKEGRE